MQDIRKAEPCPGSSLNKPAISLTVTIPLALKEQSEILTPVAKITSRSIGMASSFRAWSQWQQLVNIAGPSLARIMCP
jgi:hypothetical protein